MAEFQETVKHWRRMCRKMGNPYDNLKCEDCPLNEERICTFEISDIQDDELTVIEEKVTQWAAEHPEPVYPTWLAWLASISVIPYTVPLDEAVMVNKIGLLKQIPADIAQKLGLEPKEVK